MAYTTKKPTGLKVERSGGAFTFSWTIRDADHGAGQSFEYKKTKKDSWHKVNVTEKQTSVTVNLTLADVKYLSFRVRGKRSAYKDGKKNSITPEMSAWALKKGAWVPSKPKAPALSFELTDVNAGTFNIKYDADTSGRAVALYVQWQTCVSKNSTNPPKSGWSTIGQQTGLSDVDRDLSYTEQTEDITATGLVRWVRSRSTGNGGTTDWKYIRHAYSTPITPALKSATAKKVVSKSDTTITAKWTTQSTLLRPVDEEAVQYMIATPDGNACNPPAGGTWSDAITVKPSGKADTVTAYVSAMTTTDQCMWVRIKATHDSRTQYSAAKRVITEKLAKPAISTTVNFTTGVVTYSITKNTSCSVARHVLFWRKPDRPDVNIPVAVLANSTTSGTVTISGLIGATKSCVGVYEFVGTNNGLSVNPIMTSNVATDSDINVSEPDAPTLEQLTNDSVYVNFAWGWSGATSMDISYADNEYAWESNKQPTIYNVERTGATRWVIQDLEVGKVWYFRLRYRGLLDNEETLSDWSAPASIDLATTPETPSLVLNRGYVLPGGIVSCSWNYVNEDGAAQDSAQVCFATVEDDEVTYGDVIAHAGSEQNVSVSFADTTAGEQYYLCCRVRAESGRQSDWSAPVSVYVPEAPTVSIGGTFLTNGVLESLDGSLQVSLSTDNAPGHYAVSIIRAFDYHIDRPDDSILDGYEGETIWTQSGYHEGGSATISYTVTLSDLVGALDDGAGYTIVATVSDDLGQTVTATQGFTVAWDTQPTMPIVAVNVDRLEDISLITVTNDDPSTTDTFDIYRLSADQPELIVENGTFGTTYVDPYPALGKYGGHRIVEKSKYGDYITDEKQLAWADVGEADGDYLDELSMIIDADRVQIRLPYNIELSHRWSKDFVRTSYLGGSVQGDWNPAVLRDLTAKTVIVKNVDDDEYLSLRDLAAYAGPAHIRTPDGSSFACDIQVSEDAKYSDSKVTYSLTIKAIDPQEPDGMTLAEWNALHPEE